MPQKIKDLAVKTSSYTDRTDFNSEIFQCIHPIIWTA